MKLYTCKCLPDALQWGCVVVAKDEKQAREVIKQEVESMDGEWNVTAEDIQLEEMDMDEAGARIINPIDDYDEINGHIDWKEIGKEIFG